MVSFQLQFDIPKAENKIDHQSQIGFIGSCFSDEMAKKAAYYGYQVRANPLGTIFHPLPLADFILSVIHGKTEIDFLERDNMYFSWEASGQLYASSKGDLIQKMLKIKKEWLNYLKEMDYLFVTFGTAWGYRLLETDKIVANCHKIPTVSFTKEITDQKIISEKWGEVISDLRRLNPRLKIVFTVSPVRHFRDGLIENNRSKAVLILAIHDLVKQGVEYFPSYEIVLDELRDYRFFKRDHVHPSEEAVDYIWERFQQVYILDESNALAKRVAKVRKDLAHRSIQPESEASKLHLQRTLEQKTELSKMLPHIKWT